MYITDLEFFSVLVFFYEKWNIAKYKHKVLKGQGQEKIDVVAYENDNLHDTRMRLCQGPIQK